jgi:hypothetical protein
LGPERGADERCYSHNRGHREGDSKAADQLLPLAYDELRRLAVQRLAHERPGQTLQATALVHQAYIRLVGSGEPASWEGRGPFFAGLTTQQAAAALGVSASTAEKEWAYARSWLRVAIDRMSGERP